jgi:hypothetical protein
MLRAALFSIVLALVAAPEAPLLCDLWCHSSDAAMPECPEHELAPSSSVRSSNGCAPVAMNASGFIREEGSRAVQFDAAHALPVPRYWLLPTLAIIGQPPCSERAWPLEHRPLETALRL